jgi:hypothetical protein
MPADPAVILDAVARGGRNVTITDAITGGTLERTLEGASTLTLELHDPHRELLRASLTQAFDCQYAGVWWRLVKIGKSGDKVTLTLEDRDVAYLRAHRRPRKISRGKQTRAQFVRSLVREVGRGDSKTTPIKFYCPEVNDRQPIGKSSEDAKPERRKKADRDNKKQKGLANASNLTVKGARATAEQRRNMQRVLDVADTLKAGPKATKALVEAVIVESQVQNLTHGDRDSLGILQVRVSTSGSATRSRDIEWCVRQFLKVGFYTDPQLGGGGAMAIARRNPSASAGRVAQATQGSGVPDAYDQHASEADKWLDAYGGASGNDSGGTDAAQGTRRKYEFTRGQAGKPEDSWTAITRLAAEVNWHAFMDRGTLYFVSEDRLMQARARYVINEDLAGVHGIDFDIDQGKVSAEVTVSVRADLFDVPVGCVVAINETGIANGRWLVSAVSQGVFSEDAQLTLKAPTPKLPEPDAERTSGGGQGDNETSSASSASKGSLRDRIIAEAEKTLTTKTGFSRYSQQGALSDDPTPPLGKRTDCSQWVRAVYLKAGASDPGTNTWAMITKGKMTHSPRPGDLLISTSHVELFVGGDKTYGHGSPPIDAGSVAYHRARGLYFITFDFLDA